MRTTGATSEQIERAVRERYETTSAMRHEHPWNNLNNVLKDTMFQVFVERDARYLVRPDERIVSVADLRMIINFFDYATQHTDYRDIELYDRITALIGDDA